MYLGHINLSESFNGAGEHFVRLIESLQKQNLRQYVLVRNVALAKRLDLIEGVTVGPVVRSPVTAYCLMPDVDVVHIHDRPSWTAGLLLALTKKIPFTITRHVSLGGGNNPLSQAAIKRASGFIEDYQLDAKEHLQVYRQAVDSLRAPTVC